MARSHERSRGIVASLARIKPAVAEKNPKLTKEQLEREGLKWRSQLEIKLISEIIAAPKVEPAKLKEQEADMRVKLAELIATKLLELAKWADIYDEAENIITASWGGDLMKTALQNFRSPRWRVEHGVFSFPIATAAQAAEAIDVIRNYEHNQPQTEVARLPIAPEIEEVEQIPWAGWLNALVSTDFYDEERARTIFQHALLWLHRRAHACNLATQSLIKTDRPYPIALQRLKDCNVVVKAMEDIDRECLVIPVIHRRHFSVLDARNRLRRCNLDVTGSVLWKEKGAGPHDRDVRVLVHCHPERKLPAGTRLRDIDYDLSMDCHPFCHIRRSSLVTECNCEIVDVVIKGIVFSDMIEVTQVEENSNVFSSNLEIVVPCIRNTEEIAAGQELVLKWLKKDEKRQYLMWCPRSGGVKRASNALSEQAPSTKKGRM